MLKKKQTSPEPSWLDPRNDRKTPFTDAELETLADDFIARMADTPVWRISSPKLASCKPEKWRKSDWLLKTQTAFLIGNPADRCTDRRRALSQDPGGSQ